MQKSNFGILFLPASVHMKAISEDTTYPGKNWLAEILGDFSYIHPQNFISSSCKSKQTKTNLEALFVCVSQMSTPQYECDHIKNVQTWQLGNVTAILST